jgi:hypothetical protein
MSPPTGHLVRSLHVTQDVSSGTGDTRFETHNEGTGSITVTPHKHTVHSLGTGTQYGHTARTNLVRKLSAMQPLMVL